MRRIPIIAVLAVALVALIGCQEPQNNVPGSVGTISVRVIDSTDAKTITPGGGVDVSHYIISVENEAERVVQTSDYLPKGSMFSVSNVPAGEWRATVTAYVDRDGDENGTASLEEGRYLKVAEAVSAPTMVTVDGSVTITVTLDEDSLVTDPASGDVTVTLQMPTALAAQGTTFWYRYMITGMTNPSFEHESDLASGNAGEGGLATVTVDAEAAGLVQGAYRFEIVVQDAEADPALTSKGVDVMRLLPGLTATGSIDLDSYDADEGFDITVTDSIGNILIPALSGGQDSYVLEEGNKLTVTLSKPLEGEQKIEWYVDGEIVLSGGASDAPDGVYELTFEPGSHSVTAIVRDEGTAMSVGSLEPFHVVVDGSGISVKTAEPFSMGN